MLQTKPQYNKFIVIYFFVTYSRTICFGEVDDEVSEMTEYRSSSEFYQVPRMPSVNAEDDNTRL